MYCSIGKAEWPRLLWTELPVAEVYLGPCQTSMMERFFKIIYQLKEVDYSRKKDPL